jgi:hypothetical protein
MRKHREIRTIAFGLFAGAACNNDDATASAIETDTDAATDTDSDSEGDTDTDTDTDTDGEPVDPNPASPSVRTLLQAACDLGLRCCDRGEVDYFLGPWVDEESCTDRLFDLATVSTAAAIDLASLAGLSDVSLVVPNLAALDQAAQEGRVVVDEAAIDACRDHLRNVTCNVAEATDSGCQPLPPPPEESPCDLHKLFVGQLAEDEVCTSIDQFSLDCAPGLTCAVGLGLGISGRCVAVKQEAENCSLDEECDEGLYCSALDATCQRPRGQGEVCVFADREDPSPAPETLLLRCTEDLSCDPITSSCVARCQAGAACVDDVECDDAQELTCIVGRCGLPRTEGLPCIGDDDCEAGLQCGFDIFEPTALVCIPPKLNNAACVAHDECDSGFCRPETLRCSPQAMVGSACTSGDSAECDGGACVREEPLTTCDSPADCPITQVCDTGIGQCGTYCVAAKPDGATCDADSECSSDACIAGFCRTPPLDVGVACELTEECASSFCSYDSPRTCVELPLDLGSPCFANEECESGVCFSAGLGPLECVTGSEAGEPCGDFDRPPCNPKQYYCDQEVETLPVCAPFKETGDVCKTETECRGDCALRHGRMLCTPAAPEDEAVCDGSE